MNREDIIRMAREAGLVEEFHGVFPSMERFAKLIVSAEREACAKICDGYSDGRHANMADLCAEAIRARGQA